MDQGILIGFNLWLRKLLKIEKDKKIFATIAFGYPAVKFRNKVLGKQMPFQWN